MKVLSPVQKDIPVEDNIYLLQAVLIIKYIEWGVGIFGDQGIHLWL